MNIPIKITDKDGKEEEITVNEKAEVKGTNKTLGQIIAERMKKHRKAVKDGN